MKYEEHVYQAIQDLFEANNYGKITKREIDKMKRATVLTFYLEWEGIFGYTDTILKILAQ